MIKNFNIAISLVNINSFKILKPSISSLIESDLNQFNFKLFYWDNGSIDASLKYVEGLEINKLIIKNKINIGIVQPRIHLMDEIIKENKWDIVLEIHSDMLFPRKWINSLLEKFDNRTGILMPNIIIQDDYIFDVQKLEELIEKYKKNILIYNSTAVHPWLLNLNCIKDIGYYNPTFKEHRCEDDDFMLRVLLSKYDIKAYRGSIVFHRGGIVRKKYLGKNNNELFFKKLHGITIKSFINILSKNGKPYIIIDKNKNINHNKLSFINYLFNRLKKILKL